MSKLQLSEQCGGVLMQLRRCSRWLLQFWQGLAAGWKSVFVAVALVGLAVGVEPPVPR